MPYLKDFDKQRLLKQDLAHLEPQSSGELVYICTVAALHYLPAIPSFEDYDLAIGALECAKLELYRRKVAPHEDQKIKDNGDVYV